MRVATGEGPVLLACASPAGTIVCVRPENVSIAAAPPARENCFSGRIVDIVHAAGSIRYRWRSSRAAVVTARVASERRTSVLPMDGVVHVGWDAEDALVLPS